MSTPYDRAKPPRKAPAEYHGCRVCGADPSHFSSGKDPAPMCAACGEVPWQAAAGYGAAVLFLSPLPPQFLIVAAMVGGLVWFCYGRHTDTRK